VEASALGIGYPLASTDPGAFYAFLEFLFTTITPTTTAAINIIAPIPQVAFDAVAESILLSITTSPF
jgi:hypothetical protein